MLPGNRKCEPVTAESVLAMAAALKRESSAGADPRGAGAADHGVAPAGDAPSGADPAAALRARGPWSPREGTTVFGRFEAEAPNVLRVADVLHGPLIGGKK